LNWRRWPFQACEKIVPYRKIPWWVEWEAGKEKSPVLEKKTGPNKRSGPASEKKQGRWMKFFCEFLRNAR
jgi:hypothetical protein